MAGQDRLTHQERVHRSQLGGQLGEIGIGQCRGQFIEASHRSQLRVATGGAKVSRVQVGSLGNRGHRLQLIKEAINCGRLLSWVSYSLSDDLAGSTQGIASELRTQLADALSAQLDDLLVTVALEPLRFGFSLQSQQLSDAKGIGGGLIDNLPGLSATQFQALSVEAVGIGEPLRRLGALLQLRPHRLLLRSHQLAHRRSRVPHEDEHDDAEADQLSNE